MSGKIEKCALCGNVGELQNSHIIPAFVYKWLKNTSATGFLRAGDKINVRTQDGHKEKLLCSICEKLLNKYETEFANKIFHPFINSELDKQGSGRGIIKQFYYEEWLLKFLISVQWRLLFSVELTPNDVKNSLLIQKDNFINIWRDYLLGNRSDTGNSESYLIFMQSLAKAFGNFPKNINDKINHYILRTADGTIAYSRNKLAVYSKLGPIALFSCIQPAKLKDTRDLRIRKRGVIKLAQNLKNSEIANFIYIDRPNEVIPKWEMSDNQWQKIEDSFKSNPERVKDSLTIHAHNADLEIQRRKFSQYHSNEE